MLNHFLFILLLMPLWMDQAVGHSLNEPLGAPGNSHSKPAAQKQAIGTAYESIGALSPVWFTISEGVIGEVFYPNVHEAQVNEIQFIVTDGIGYFSEQKRDTISKIQYHNEGMSVQISGVDRLGLYSYTQEIATDSSSPTLRIHTVFKWNKPDLKLFIQITPKLDNSPYKTLGYVGSQGLFAMGLNSSTHLALLSSKPWISTSSGYLGYSDGLNELSQNFFLSKKWPQVGPGNIALTGEISTGEDYYLQVDLALTFGQSPNEVTSNGLNSLKTSFDQIRNQYNLGWNSYIDQLRSTNHSPRFLTNSLFAQRSAQIIKMHEDKLNRGEFRSSFSPSRQKPQVPSPIHLKLLYSIGVSLLAAGDTQTPVQIFKYLVSNQKIDGSWSPSDTPSVGLNEMAFAILLAGQLNLKKIYEFTNEDLEAIRKTVSYLIQHRLSNPVRSPDIQATEIASLRVASQVIQDPTLDLIASQWESSIEKSTLDQKARIEGSTFRSPAPTQPIDSGFLQLVRMGLRSPQDPRVLSTFSLYENPKSGLANVVSQNPGGIIFHQLVPNPNGIGTQVKLMPTSTAELGQFFIASKNHAKAERQLALLEYLATPEGMIPEYVNFTSSRLPTQVELDVVCPSVWAHAEDILLHRSIEEGAVFDTPKYHQFE